MALSNASPDYTPSSSTPTIKILHENPSFRLCTGEDASYLAIDFFKNSCKDAMTNSNVTDDRDKISFICCNLKSDSKTAKMMSASTFDPRKIKHNCAIFLHHFLEVFGRVQRHDSLQ